MGYCMDIAMPIDYQKSECEDFVCTCANALMENKIPAVSFDIRTLSAKLISVIRDTMKRYDCIVETSSMYETEILTFERKK
jgi:hypothetical protein